MNPQSVFIDPLLTSVYVGYKNTELIADLLFPKVAVNKESGIYFKSDKSNLLAPGSTLRGLTGLANRVNGKLLQDTYTLEEHSLEEWIDDRILKTYDDPFNPRSNATNRIAGQLQIEKEVDAVDIVAASGASALDADASWNTAATDLRSQINTGADAMQKKAGVRPNTIVIDRISWSGLLKNTGYSNAIATTTDKSESVLLQFAAAYFGVKRVLIAGGIQQTAAESGTGSFIWSTKGKVVLAYVAENPQIEEPTAGYQFYKPDMVGVDVRREEGNKSDVVRATDFYTFKIVDADCLYLINDTIIT